MSFGQNIEFNAAKTFGSSAATKFGVNVYLFYSVQPGIEVIKLLLCSYQLNMKFILLINVKIPTVVGILTFISRSNTTYVNLRTRNYLVYHYFTFYEIIKFS